MLSRNEFQKFKTEHSVELIRINKRFNHNALLKKFFKRPQKIKCFIMKQHNNPFKIFSSRILISVLVLYSLAACAPINKSESQSETSTIESTPDLLLEMNNTASEENTAIETTIQSPDIKESEQSKTTEPQVKLNPPHGEPGHRCDIAVGAPLDSPAPNKTQPTAKPSVTPVPSTTNTATLPSTGRVGPTIENLKNFRPSPPVNSSTVSINPPHGQPGHRCDIPVGSPLPS